MCGAHTYACTRTAAGGVQTTTFSLEPKLQLTSSIADTPLLFGIMRHNSIFKSLDRDRGYDFHPPTGRGRPPDRAKERTVLKPIRH
uniref:Uncharacterized protein n=1 Tax=Physcomitrium patens TaxID=3218 RepID=A0A7I4BVU8_PHYPA